MEYIHNKPRVLFNFGYHRKGWIAPIERLRDVLDITYIFFLDPALETARHTTEKVVFWNDFTSAQQLLDKLKPDKIVFMSIDSGLNIVLNHVARKRGVRTYILQHGLLSNYADYRSRDRKSKGMRVPSERPQTSFSTGAFFKSSLSLADLAALWLFPLHNYLRKKESQRFADRWVRFNARMPDFYICYTEQNSLIHRQTDAPLPSKFRYIGIPELDEFFVARRSSPHHRYFLLIDQPFADNRYGEHICSREQMIAHYETLNNYCVANGARLVVKLHPESYHSDWLPDHENITWLRDTAELPDLVLNAEGCFGYFSTLLLPAIVFNRCVLFRVSENEMQRDAHRFGLAALIDFFNYHPDDFRWDRLSKEGLNEFVQKYLLFADGKSVDRLRDILLE